MCDKGGGRSFELAAGSGRVWLRLLGNPDPDLNRSRMDGMTAVALHKRSGIGRDGMGWDER